MTYVFFSSKQKSEKFLHFLKFGLLFASFLSENYQFFSRKKSNSLLNYLLIGEILISKSSLSLNSFLSILIQLLLKSFLSLNLFRLCCWLEIFQDKKFEIDFIFNEIFRRIFGEKIFLAFTVLMRFLFIFR